MNQTAQTRSTAMNSKGKHITSCASCEFDAEPLQTRLQGICTCTK